MSKLVLLSSVQLRHTISRLSYQLIENHGNFEDSVIVGLQPRGVVFSKRIVAEVESILGHSITSGTLDATFYRDDFRHHKGPIIPKTSDLNFPIENKKVILVDDVLFTGRTIRAGMDALLDFGRPSLVELVVLIDRRYARQVPVQPDFTGRVIDTISSEKVKVEWKESEGIDQVILFSQDITE
ncbi:MAG: bifunctional pyr operon transcriptional regulator/uracil phosphoribosyltransferase PyrR [Bacteroidia bacterium]|nr:bifunctional pyr operon transcriptional regulator/uracil phosphoribosyltransferase PyrR [Bacteroidia bacterium]